MTTDRAMSLQRDECVPESGRDAQAIQAWIVKNLETALELEPGEVEVDEPFDQYGLDSVEAVNLISALEDWLEVELAPNLAYEYPTIRSLSEHLAEATAPAAAGG